MIGPGTKAIAAEGCIVTAGAIVRTSISSARNSTTSPLPSHGTRRCDDLRRGGAKRSYGRMAQASPARHARLMRGARHFVCAILKTGSGVDRVVDFVTTQAGWEIERRNALYPRRDLRRYKVGGC